MRLIIGGHVIPSDAVQAVGRFRPEGPTRYGARPPYAPPDAPLRATRAEALADVRALRALTDALALAGVTVLARFDVTDGA